MRPTHDVDETLAGNRMERAKRIVDEQGLALYRGVLGQRMNKILIFAWCVLFSSWFLSFWYFHSSVVSLILILISVSNLTSFNLGL